MADRGAFVLIVLQDADGKTEGAPSLWKPWSLLTVASEGLYFPDQSNL